MKKILILGLSVFVLFGCTNNISKKAPVEKETEATNNPMKGINEQDNVILSKLWSSYDFRNNKDKRFRSLEDAYRVPDSVINLAVYSGFNGVIPENIDTFKNVQLIGMNNNNLTNLPSTIGNLVFLQEVHLNKNSFTVFPEELTNNRYLKTILISDNNIEKITPNIKNLVYLENLVMNDNKISVLPAELFELTNLKVLGLRNNGIGELSDKFGQLSKLEKLNLQNNNLKELPESLINSCVNLQRITLRGNPMSGSYVEELRKKMPGTEIEF